MSHQFFKKSKQAAVHYRFTPKYGNRLCKALSKAVNKKEDENKQAFINRALCPGTLGTYVSKAKNILWLIKENSY